MGKDCCKEQQEFGQNLNPAYNKDGLLSVITIEQDTNIILMFAYMNEEALHKTIETKKACYYSRSRQKLWLKGETSGQFQHVEEIYFDCDQDCIILKVSIGEKGVACHNGFKSCFYRKVEGLGGKAENAKLKIVDSVIIPPEELY